MSHNATSSGGHQPSCSHTAGDLTSPTMPSSRCGPRCRWTTCQSWSASASPGPSTPPGGSRQSWRTSPSTTNRPSLSIIEYASPDCRVSHITTISEAAWPDLARSQRFPLTFPNLSAYVAKIAVDENLAVPPLSDPGLPDFASVDDDQLGELPYAILNAGSVLADPSARVQIVGSLQPAAYLSTDRISWEKNGRLAGLLVAENLVEDDGAAYDAIASSDWATKKLLISKSENFALYATPQQLPAADLKQRRAGSSGTRRRGRCSPGYGSSSLRTTAGRCRRRPITRSAPRPTSTPTRFSSSLRPRSRAPRLSGYCHPFWRESRWPT